MYISSAEVSNYKSFDEPVRLSFEPGFNIIAGPNNAGKTALIEALSLRFSAHPHRSLRTVLTPDHEPNPESSVEVAVTTEKSELLGLLKQGLKLFVPFPRHDSEFPRSIGCQPAGPPFWHKLPGTILERETNTFRGRLVARDGTNPRWVSTGSPSFGLYLPQQVGDDWEGATYECLGPGQFHLLQQPHRGRPDGEFGVSLVLPRLASRIYHFRAERFNVGTCAFGNSRVLAPNASNLPEVLNTLQANSNRFERFNARVSDILPQVRRVSVRSHPIEEQRLEAIVWPHDPASERLDLAVPLKECGTGIGQVLAIVCVVLNSEYPQTILVDEPQSFLHPGAVKRLVEVLRDYPQHQYIFSTHSPTVIAACEPRTFTVLKYRDGVSTAGTADASRLGDVQIFLAEVGASLSDVFGADSVLWVEGLTEEICFPRLLERVARKSLRGTTIRGVRNTGDFTGRRADLIVDVYSRLSQGGCIVPPAVGFFFDDEGRTKAEKSELQHRSGGRTTFTCRRMYENYLLNSTAIAAVVNSIPGFRGEAVTAEEIEHWIDRNRDSYGDGEPWPVHVHAGRMLPDLFRDLSERRVEYKKTEHSVKLTEWLLEHAPQELIEIASLVAEAIDRGKQTPPADGEAL